MTVIFNDQFNGTFSGWRSIQCDGSSSACTIVNSPTNSSNNVFRAFYDVDWAAGGGTERSELSAPGGYFDYNDTSGTNTRYYGMMIYVPTSHTAGDRSVIINQIQQGSDVGGQPAVFYNLVRNASNPSEVDLVLGLRYTADRQNVSSSNPLLRQSINLGTVQKGRWFYLRYRIAFEQNGGIELRTDATGTPQTRTINVPLGYVTDRIGSYMKIGVYASDANGNPQDYVDQYTVYYDDIRMSDASFDELVTTTPPSNPVTIINEPFTSSTQPLTVVGGGVFSVVSGELRLTSPAGTPASGDGNGNIAIHPTLVSGNYTLTVKGKVTPTSGGFDDYSVIFDFQDGANYYYANLNEAANSSSLSRVSGGTATNLVSFTAGITPGVYDTIKLVKSGSNVSLYRGTTLLASATSVYSSGRIGVGSRNDAATFDDLLVTQP